MSGILALALVGAAALAAALAVVVWVDDWLHR